VTAMILAFYFGLYQGRLRQNNQYGKTECFIIGYHLASASGQWDYTYGHYYGGMINVIYTIYNSTFNHSFIVTRQPDDQSVVLDQLLNYPINTNISCYYNLTDHTNIVLNLPGTSIPLNSIFFGVALGILFLVVWISGEIYHKIHGNCEPCYSMCQKTLSNLYGHGSHV